MNGRDSDAIHRDAPKRAISPLKAALFLLVLMSGYAYACLSRSKAVLPAAIGLFGVLEAIYVLRNYRKLAKLVLSCEVLYSVTFISVCLGVYFKTFEATQTFLLATIFYRPYYTLRCNRRLALILGLLILGLVLSVSFGLVADPDSVGFLTALYVVMVVGLWVLCSKLGAKVFGFAEES
jgi:hypothetical protein